MRISDWSSDVCSSDLVAPFADLQKRLGRKSVGRKLLEEAPAHMRLYDILFAAGEDLRYLPFEDRRARLEVWYGKNAPARIDQCHQTGRASGREKVGQ